MPYDDLTNLLLAKRGITTTEEAEKFLNPSYDEHLVDPLTIKNMPQAASRLAAAILSGEKIAAWTDYDCDGIPAAVILHDFLKKAGANFENYIPHRHLEGYGVNSAGVEKLAKNGAKLLITADVGITDTEVIARARALGMDTIVTDHHLPGDGLPEGIVVDPNAHPDETAPFKSWCGAGLAWKLVCATLSVAPELRERVPEGWEKWLLDMAALATIADMVPLVGDNRLIARYGLLVLRKSPRIGVGKLCRLMRLEQSRITEDDVGFMLAPRVNAASRMDDPLEAFRLFITADESEADALAKKLEKLNRERKAQTGAITRAVRERLADRSNLQSVIALGDPSWRPALLGLVANGIAEEYARPVFLWGREGNDTLKGSCRSEGATHMVALMQAAEDTFAEFGGHAFSGGFTVLDEAVFSLEDRLVAALATLPVEEAPVEREPDADLAPCEADGPLLAKLERLAPYGEGNEKPLLRLHGCEIARVERFGKGKEHVKFKVARDESEKPLEAVAFFAKGALATYADALSPGSQATLLGHLERDSFSRAPRLRLIGIVPA
ncbi:MAG TPA: single-stranded-DNA-specific exonuclease RecJ [Candidatus Paceibacterota bacterium]|nr:single-stranded-DNA-specific exonuclease RecJ [Candidatus Paceibacterota bacterium]